MQALADELNSLTDIGAVSHGHTRADLIAMGITAPPIATQVVFENKFKPADHAGKSADDISAELRGSMPNEAATIVDAKIEAALKLVQFMMDGRVTTDVSFDKRKARVVAVGSKRNMQQGIHFFDTFAATPRTETANVMSALIVMMKLYRKAFDIKNAFNWAKQKIKLALDYPYDMPQYAVVNGRRERLYMALHKNTYGKPDGSRLFEEERNGVWLEKLNEDGFTCVLPFCDKSLFYVTFRVEDCESQDLIEKIRIEKESDTRLRDLPFISCYMLVHTDDANMASESVAVMDLA